MTRILLHNIASKVGLGNLFKPTVLDKQHFLNELKKVSKTRDLADRSISSMDLMDKYKGKETETLNWLSGVALDKNEKNFKYRQQAIHCFRWLNKPEQIETLIKCLDDDNADIRCEAVKIISGLNDSRVVPLLLKCSNDVDKNVRFWSVDHLRSKSISTCVRCQAK